MDDLLPLSLLLLALACAACDGGSGSCDPEALRARLAAAAPGDTVTLEGECTVAGPLEIPAGVTLSGSERTVVSAAVNDHALVLLPSPDASTPTAAVGLVAASDGGCAAILADGAGAVAIRDVTIRATTGVGLAIQGASSVVIDGVTCEGPVAADDADSTVAPTPPFTCGSSDIATHGLVLVDVGDASVTDTSVSGFGRFGVLSIRTALTASMLDVHDNLGAGLEIWDGSATLTTVNVDATRDGLSAVEVYGTLLGGGAVVDATDLVVTGGDGYGVFADGAMATLETLTSTDNAFAGVWAQHTDGFTVSGSGTMIANNAFAGVALLDSTAAAISDATIRETAEGIAINGLGTVMAADGVHLSASDATLASLSLVDNVRVGAVLDLDGASTDRLSITGVTVDASGSAYGVVAQDGTLVDGWDDGVMRLGDTPANDAAFSEALGIAAGVGPPCLPPIDGLDTGGIAALVGL